MDRLIASRGELEYYEPLSVYVTKCLFLCRNTEFSNNTAADGAGIQIYNTNNFTIDT